MNAIDAYGIDTESISWRQDAEEVLYDVIYASCPDLRAAFELYQQMHPEYLEADDFTVRECFDYFCGDYQSQYRKGRGFTGLVADYIDERNSCKNDVFRYGDECFYFVPDEAQKFGFDIGWAASCLESALRPLCENAPKADWIEVLT